MSLTTDPTTPCLREYGSNGQQKCYLVLSDDEIAKGFVAPVRKKYKHLVCGGVTYMADKLAETYARDPSFYGGTFCSICGGHFNLRNSDGVRQFEWIGQNGQPDGTFVGEFPEKVPTQ